MGTIPQIKIHCLKNSFYFRTEVKQTVVEDKSVPVRGRPPKRRWSSESVESQKIVTSSKPKHKRHLTTVVSSEAECKLEA